MKNEISVNSKNSLIPCEELAENSYNSIIAKNEQMMLMEHGKNKPEILFITSYPPRECGIATYSQDLIKSIQDKFLQSFSLKVCALEENDTLYYYPENVKYILKSAKLEEYFNLANKINNDSNLHLIFLQHEFGLYGGEYGEYLLQFLSTINKPVVTTFHTVLPNPDRNRKVIIQSIFHLSAYIVVMTKNSANILAEDYDIPADKIIVIPHGTHLVTQSVEKGKKSKNYLGNRLVLSTFGLLSSGKSIETAIDALPQIVAEFPNVLYLVIGKTHPSIVKCEGEKYRNFLQEKVIALNLQNNVRFINKYLSLPDLLDYLQRTDIYLFTSKDPHQAVSGTFAYAMAGGCPVISTPIPHAVELLDGAGIIVDFQDSTQLAEAAIKLLSKPDLLQEMRLNALHKMSPTAWQNSAIAHTELFVKNMTNKTHLLQYEIPEISLKHIRRMTTDSGIVQFASVDIPDMASGYTLDDNARALIAITKHYELTGETADIQLIDTYLNFIVFCQQTDGKFLNYVDNNGNFFDKNSDENLEDSNGRAVWALGEFISYEYLFHNNFIERATLAFENALPQVVYLYSPRAISFVIKGLYHYDIIKNEDRLKAIITKLADNLVSKYRGVSDKKWRWFEDYLTYANSVLPESLLYAYLSTGNELFVGVAKSSFDFLLANIFQDNQIKVISNKGWKMKGQEANKFGEQPIDVAYTILALDSFYEVFREKKYLEKIQVAFNWFLGENHLHQIIYNPCTGGCYDGLEEYHINLNQGAESTVSYLLSRLTVEKYFTQQYSLETNTEWKLNQFELV